MLEWSIRQNEHPVAIRVPATEVISYGEPAESDYSNLNRYKVVHRGSKVAIVALGSFFGLGQSVLSLLKNKANIDATLINPRYITGVDSELMDELKADHELVITLEDGVLDGGFGEKIARFYGRSHQDCPLLWSDGYESSQLRSQKGICRPLRRTRIAPLQSPDR